MILTSVARLWTLTGMFMLVTTPLFAAEQGGTSSTTNYWYGGELHPLVVERDGVTYRLIGKGIIEEATAAPARTYAHADHLGSVRLVTDDAGDVVQSLSYDGDYGATRITGQSYASTDDSVASFYRFQGQEQEIFPLAKLGVGNPALAQWLDRIALYHFPWRDYAAGLAAFAETDPVPTQDSLYAALGANPVNVTDETGGMIQLDIDVPRYNPAHRQISARLQGLLDRLLQDPSANFEFNEIVELSDLRLAIFAQRYNRNNPFAPDGLLGKRRLETHLGHVEVTEQRRRDARAAFRVLHQEQDRWLDTYSRPIGQLWGSMNKALGRNLFGEVEEKTGADELQTNAPDQEGDSKMPDLTDLGSGISQPHSIDAEIQPNPLLQPIEENEEHDAKQEEHEEEHEDEEHRGNDRICCHIL